MGDKDVRDLILEKDPDLAMSLFPHTYSQRVVGRKPRTNIEKQWSIDDTQTWFYSRPSSLERHNNRKIWKKLSLDQDQPQSQGQGSPQQRDGSPNAMTAEKRRKFFKRRGATMSVPSGNGDSAVG